MFRKRSTKKYLIAGGSEREVEMQTDLSHTGPGDCEFSVVIFAGHQSRKGESEGGK